MTKREMQDLAVMIADELTRREKENGLVDIEKASGILGLTKGSIYQMKDKIGYVKRGKRLMFSVRNLEAYNELRTRG